VRKHAPAGSFWAVSGTAVWRIWRALAVVESVFVIGGTIGMVVMGLREVEDVLWEEVEDDDVLEDVDDEEGEVSKEELDVVELEVEVEVEVDVDLQLSFIVKGLSFSKTRAEYLRSAHTNLIRTAIAWATGRHTATKNMSLVWMKTRLAKAYVLSLVQTWPEMQ
jgi:hypothetical protein